VDTTGLLLIVLVTTGAVQDRDAARALLWALRTCFTGALKVWADAGYAGQLVDWATEALGLAVEIVRKLAYQVGFQVLHRRWVVERNCRGSSAAGAPSGLRAPSRTPRRDGPMGHGHRHDPTPGPLPPHRTPSTNRRQHRLT